MPTLSLVILKSKKRKNNTYEIKISVAHNGQTRYLPTNIYVQEDEFKSGRIVRRPDANIKNIALLRLLQDYENRILDIDYVKGLTCPELVYALTATSKDIPTTIGSIFDEYVSTARVKESTKHLMRMSIKSVYECLGYDFPVKKITYAKIMLYEKHLRTKGNTDGTVRTKMAVFSKIINYALKSGYVKFDINPFKYYTYPIEPVRDSWLTIDQLKRLRDFNFAGPYAKLRDFIILSFYLGGINAVDVLKLDFAKVLETGIVRYQRTKTENFQKYNTHVEFKLPPEARPVIGRLMESDGYIGTISQRRTRLHSLKVEYLRHLRKVVGADNLVYYSARKTFSQIAFELGIKPAVIDYILGHKINKSGTSLYKYVGVTPEMASNAIRTVLDYVK